MNIGKKILSALVELPEEEMKHVAANVTNGNVQTKMPDAAAPDVEKFRRHFSSLIEEANEPGPDYFEFFRMIAAMRAISDEGARYQAAFAGLQAQGLDKTRLLQSAKGYLGVLDKDALQFRNTVDIALQEKVQARKAELEANQRRIGELTQEIANLQERNSQLADEIGEQSAKLESNGAAYELAWQQEQARILEDIERINKHIS
jgi:hypothetical protein